jgi:photosystem II stability/assembly factor-like uncharacterized protein
LADKRLIHFCCFELRPTGKLVGLIRSESIFYSRYIIFITWSFILSMNRLWIFLGLSPRPGQLAQAVILLLLALTRAELPAQGLPAQGLWNAVGPAGGDARAFATVPGQPNHLYLGTTNSWIYESLDKGASWHRLVKLDPTEDLVADRILVDSAHPEVIFAGGWKPDQRDGGLWVSRDGGVRFTAVKELRGQSVFSLAQAPSNPKMLFAGTWDGVFRSADGGASWTLISPPGNTEIHEVESLAVDPLDPNIIYVGTWHLPWKTDDGGKHWYSIKNGLIDDSDVFSIIIEPGMPFTVYLSACTGIYKSESAGLLFDHIQGIPTSARRTRVLKQDPENPDVVYAGTTEGLYKTVDAGATFQRMTVPDLVVNDIFVDPADSAHVLLATDRGGVLASTDGGATFAASNAGFSGRKVEALLVDRANPNRIYAGVVNDKTYGGVFISTDAGVSWSQIGQGLAGLDVFALAQSADGTVLAGTSHGIFALDLGNAPDPSNANAPSPNPPNPDPSNPATPNPDPSNPDQPNPAPVWQPRNLIANFYVQKATETHAGKRIKVEKHIKIPTLKLDSRVNALDLSSDVWLASTNIDLLTSRDQGASWQGGPVMGSGDYVSVAAHGSTMAAARADLVILSTDGGWTWAPMQVPVMVTRIQQVAFSKDGTLWLGAREGVYFTRDTGKTWLWIERFPFRDVDDLSYDSSQDKVLVSSRQSQEVYAIDPKTLKWKWWDTGYRIGQVRAAGERLLAASLHDGVLVEPQPAGVASRKQ